MVQISLHGEQCFITSKQNCCYRILSGKILVYIASISSTGDIERKFFLYESENKMLRIPAFYTRDTIQGNWALVFTSLGDGTIVEEIPEKAEWEDIVLTFARTIKLPIISGEDFEAELIERIERQLVAEELFIYRNATEQEKLLSQNLRAIASVFHKDDDFGEVNQTNNHLYNTVAYLCKTKGIYIAPYETIVESCGRRFTLQDIARVSHFMIREVKLENKWFTCDSGDLIVYMETEEESYIPVVCLPKGSKKYVACNLEDGTISKVNQELNARFLKTAYMIYKPLPNTKISGWELIRFVVKEIKREDIITILLFTLIGTLIGLLIPYLNQAIYDDYIPFGSRKPLLLAGFLVLSFTLGNVCFLVVKNLSLFRMSVRMEYNLQSAVFSRVFHLPGSLYETHDSSELAKSAFGITEIVNLFTEVIITTVLSGIFSLIYFGRMVVYSGGLAIMALGMILINSLVVLLLGLKQIKYEKADVDYNMKETSAIYQFLDGIAKLRIAGAENRAMVKYFDLYTKHKKILTQKDKLSYATSGINQFLNVLFLTVFYAVLVNEKGNLSLGSFMGFMAAYGAFSSSMIQVAVSFLTVNRFIPVYEKAKIILDTGEEFKEGLGMVGKLEGSIEVNNLCFAYQKGEENILADVSFKIHSGEYVGIVGSSGSGKSTLLKLLMGFEKPSSGKIYYDEKDLEGLDKRELRKSFGVVLQDGKLIAGSIYENIAIASVAVTKEEKEREVKRVWQVIKEVGFDKDISNMPMGLQTIISEGAGGISGGQRQKILIARAIFNYPQILIFDEATSALDNVNQALVTKNLEKLKVTRIVIAHRLSTVKKCDRILVMDNGRIVECGNYEELIKQKGYFYQLSLRQTA